MNNKVMAGARLFIDISGESVKVIGMNFELISEFHLNTHELEGELRFAISGDDELIAAGFRSGLSVISTSDGELIWTYRHGGYLDSLVASGDWVIANCDGIFAINKIQEVRELDDHFGFQGGVFTKANKCGRSEAFLFDSNLEIVAAMPDLNRVSLKAFDANAEFSVYTTFSQSDGFYVRENGCDKLGRFITNKDFPHVSRVFIMGEHILVSGYRDKSEFCIGLLDKFDYTTRDLVKLRSFRFHVSPIRTWGITDKWELFKVNDGAIDLKLGRSLADLD